MYDEVRWFIESPYGLIATGSYNIKGSYYPPNDGKSRPYIKNVDGDWILYQPEILNVVTNPLEAQLAAVTQQRDELVTRVNELSQQLTNERMRGPINLKSVKDLLVETPTMRGLFTNIQSQEK